jgi:hypothetical protein
MRSPESVERLVQPLYGWASSLCLHHPEMPGAVMRA